MMVLVTVYFQFFAPDPGPTKTVDGPGGKSVPSGVNTFSPGMPARDSAKAMKYGLAGEKQTVVVETDQIIVSFSNKGGAIQKVILKEYLDFEGKPLALVDKHHSDFHLYVDLMGKKTDLNDLYFTPPEVPDPKLAPGDTLRIGYRLELPNGGHLDYGYVIPGSGYEIGFNIRQNGLRTVIGEEIRFAWNQKINRVEKDLTDSRNRTTVKFRYTDGGVDGLSETSQDKEEETLALPSNWVSFKQKFFTSAIVAEKPFVSGHVQSYIDLSDTASVKNTRMSMTLPYGDFMANASNFTYYFGPNNYAILKGVAPGFSDNVDLGWSILAWINKFAVIPIFHFLEKYISNYGVIIVVIVIILRIVLAPLTYSSHIGMAKMRVMKPELDEIKENHKGDLQKTQQEQMALYQKVGINPLSGCIPMVLQMPILFAMFYFFPNSIELRQEKFLWAHDLSTYDSILNLPFNIPFYGDHVSLFTLLMTVSTILYTWSNSQMTAQMNGPMKSVQYVMPVMFLFFLNNYASGLTFYYFVSNIVSFGQVALFKKFIDEEKIKKILNENKKKNANKKKSPFQKRLDEAMKAQEQKRKNKNRKK